MFNKLFGSADSENNLDAERFQAKMQEKDTIVLDVRTKQEFRDGHLKGAINIDFYESFEEKINKLDKLKTYLLYCRSGSRSDTALKMMKKSGFSNVSHLEDGIISWDGPLQK